MLQAQEQNCSAGWQAGAQCPAEVWGLGFRDNGKENGNYDNGLYRVYIGLILG